TPTWLIDRVKPFESVDAKKLSVAYTSSQLGWQYVDRLSLKEPGSEIRDQSGRVVCRINQVLGTLPKTYVLDCPNAADGLPSAMFVLVEGARVANEYRRKKHESKHRRYGQ
ncbi:MAG: hypothetical protein IKE23_10390, partial [Exiguobacterium sp.]|nr:hypothetical protein [Exiguobacterium sp.]